MFISNVLRGYWARMADQSIRIVIADDDEPIRNLLKNYLCFYEEVKVVGTAADGKRLVEVVRETLPDAVFIDIQMPGMDGLSAVYRLQAEFPSLFVVFVSAHAHYAAEAYSMDATDFLVKPFSRERIGKALNKIKRYKEMNDKILSFCNNDGIPAEPANSALIMLKSGHGIIMVEKNNIVFVEKQGRKCLVHTTRGIYETTHSLTAIEDSLDKPNFFRCHKGFIINVRQVEKISPYADRAYEISFYNYPLKAPMRRNKFEEFCLMIKCE